ncbi:hypothetical protein V7128_02080 [Neobacillus vireti]|uniref:hypothetical protein n=1 Tax=Neobacillus vireti TaxID=220686 RepID=UPI0030000009
MKNNERLELIKQRVNMPVPNYLKEDFDWLLQRFEELQFDMKFLKEIHDNALIESEERWNKLSKIKEILNA